MESGAASAFPNLALTNDFDLCEAICATACSFHLDAMFWLKRLQCWLQSSLQHSDLSISMGSPGAAPVSHIAYLRRHFLFENLLQVWTKVTRLDFDIFVQVYMKKHLSVYHCNKLALETAC